MWKRAEDIPGHDFGGPPDGKYDPFEPLETFVTYCEGLLLEGDSVRLVAGLESATVARADLLAWRQDGDGPAYEVRIRKGARILVQRAVIAEPGGYLFAPFGEQESGGEEHHCHHHGHGHEHEEHHCHHHGHGHGHGHGHEEQHCHQHGHGHGHEGHHCHQHGHGHGHEEQHCHHDTDHDHD